MRLAFQKPKQKEIWVQCPFGKPYTKDFCDPGHPFRINLSSPDAHDLMNAHIEMHTERGTAIMGLTIKRIGCQVCEWTSAPFESNNASMEHALGAEEAETINLYEAHMASHEKCERHVTPGQQKLVYHFRTKDEKDLHDKLLHAVRVKLQNKPRLKRRPL